MERLSASSRLREDGAARRARRGIQEGVEAVASQPAVVPGGSADVTPVAGGTSMTALPSAMKELARFFLNLSGSSSLGASGVSAGVTAWRCACWWIHLGLWPFAVICKGGSEPVWDASSLAWSFGSG